MSNPNKKALIMVTNHTDFQKPNVEPTGLWLSELTHFYDVMQARGIECKIVSLLGGKIEIDQRSLGFMVLDKATKKSLKNPEFMALLENTDKLSDIDSNEYDILYYAGGHGAMWDFAESDEINNLTRDFYESGKLVSAVCHGVAALQNVTLSNGEYLIKDKRATGFAYFDEMIAGVKKIVPYNMEARLKSRGMKYSKAFLPLGEHVVVDGNLITGQNPNSATLTAKKVADLALN